MGLVLDHNPLLPSLCGVVVLFSDADTLLVFSQFDQPCASVGCLVFTEQALSIRLAVAERLNGILNHEYLDMGHVDSIEDVHVELERAVFLYKTQRPHASISMITPDHVLNDQLHVQRSWKS